MNRHERKLLGGDGEGWDLGDIFDRLGLNQELESRSGQPSASEPNYKPYWDYDPTIEEDQKKSFEQIVAENNDLGRNKDRSNGIGLPGYDRLADINRRGEGQIGRQGEWAKVDTNKWGSDALTEKTDFLEREYGKPRTNREAWDKMHHHWERKAQVARPQDTGHPRYGSVSELYQAHAQWPNDPKSLAKVHETDSITEKVQDVVNNVLLDAGLAYLTKGVSVARSLTEQGILETIQYALARNEDTEMEDVTAIRRAAELGQYPGKLLKILKR